MTNEPFEDVIRVILSALSHPCLRGLLRDPPKKRRICTMWTVFGLGDTVSTTWLGPVHSIASLFGRTCSAMRTMSPMKILGITVLGRPRRLRAARLTWDSTARGSQRPRMVSCIPASGVWSYSSLTSMPVIVSTPSQTICCTAVFGERPVKRSIGVWSLRLLIGIHLFRHSCMAMWA